RSFLQAPTHELEIRAATEHSHAPVSALRDMNRKPGDKLTMWPSHALLTRAARWCLTPLSTKWCLTPLLVLVACQAIDPHNMIGRQMGEATPVATEPVPSPPP